MFRLFKSISLVFGLLIFSMPASANYYRNKKAAIAATLLAPVMVALYAAGAYTSKQAQDHVLQYDDPNYNEYHRIINSLMCSKVTFGMASGLTAVSALAGIFAIRELPDHWHTRPAIVAGTVAVTGALSSLIAGVAGIVAYAKEDNHYYIFQNATAPVYGSTEPNLQAAFGIGLASVAAGWVVPGLYIAAIAL